MSLYKKFILFLAFVSACFCVFVIADTYAKYSTSATQITNIPIARWNIKVNNVSIKNGQSLSSVIVPVFPGNEHIADGIIAPTAEGYFDLDLDFSSADVSFSYTISMSPNENSSVTDLVITGYSVDDGEITPFDSSTGNTLTDNIYYTDNIDARKIRVYIKWDDDINTATMDNVADTAATFDSSNGALLDITASFVQIAENPTESETTN